MSRPQSELHVELQMAPMNSSKTKFIILGATEEELAPSRSRIAEPLPIDFRAIGVGLIAASINLTRILAGAIPEQARVIFIGSIGSYDRDIPLLSLVLATESVAADPAVAADRSFLPTATNIRLRSDHELTEQLQRRIQSPYLEPIATTPSITRDERQANLLRQHYSCRFENLELHAIASVCATLQIPWASLNCVTNLTSSEGHTQWVENRFAAAEITAKALQVVLEQLFSR